MQQDNFGRGRLITDEDASEISRVEELAYDLRVEEVMTRDVKTLTPEMPMSLALDIFRSARISGAPVLAGSKIVGVISLEDLIRCITLGNMDATVETYMARQVVTVRGGEPLVEALKLFVTTRHGRLPVIDENGQLTGIITKGDITLGILKAVQRDYQAEEVRRYRASHLFEDITSDRTSLILRYNIKQGDFTQGGTASSFIKRALLRLGASPQIARRCGIATYEAEMNLIIHTTNGGYLRVEIEPHQIKIEAIDEGPGIKDINLAMRPGYSTATEQIRELGFGAGMGLINISRCVDDMKLESTFGKGTHLRLKIFLPQPVATGGEKAAGGEKTAAASTENDNGDSA